MSAEKYWSCIWSSLGDYLLPDYNISLANNSALTDPLLTAMDDRKFKDVIRKVMIASLFLTWWLSTGLSVVNESKINPLTAAGEIPVFFFFFKEAVTLILRAIG